MHIKSIRIKNVKSISNEITVNFHDKVNVLIGPNGGGKSNILDIITAFLRKDFIHPFSRTIDNTTKEITIERHVPEMMKRGILQKHNMFPHEQSFLEIEFSVTDADRATIGSLRLSRNFVDNHIARNRIKTELGFGSMDRWDPKKLEQVNSLKYSITDFKHIKYPPSTEEASILFKDYLVYWNYFAVLYPQFNANNVLSAPFLSFSSSRLNFSTPPSFDLNACYSDFLAFQNGFSNDLTNLLNVGFNCFIAKLLKYQSQAKENGFGENIKRDPQFSDLEKYAKWLGFDIYFEADASENKFQMMLRKNGKLLQLSAVSSGEREIIHYLVAILGLNMEHASILIDEPEVHLHPKWSTLLHKIFEDMATHRHLQFIIATHSSTFVTADNLGHVIRIAKENSGSTIVKTPPTIDDRSLHEMIHNEMGAAIFSDFVLLVEGPCDLIVFNNLIATKLDPKTIQTFTLMVRGKGSLYKHKSFLDGLGIATAIITDFDYIYEDNKFKRYGNDVKNIDGFQDPKQKREIEEFITSSAAKGIFISRRNLEDYTGMKKSVSAYLKLEDFPSAVDVTYRDEFNSRIEQIVSYAIEKVRL